MRRFALSLALAVILAGCGGSQTAAPGATETGPPPETGTTLPEAKTSIVVYFLRGEQVAPVYREVPQTAAVGTAAVEALLAGPSASEEELGLRSALPAGGLSRLTVADGAAAVDLSAGSLSNEALAQLTFTLTQFPTVRGVWVGVKGEPIGPQDHPLTRDDFPDLLPIILVEHPALGETVSSPVQVSGSASVFEATLRVRLVGPDGGTLWEDTVMASEGAPGRGTFAVGIPFTASGPGKVVAFTLSAADGSEQHNVEVPVRLAP